MNNDPLGFGGFVPMNQPTTNAQPKKKQKNFLIDQISTVGGIVGGIGGGLLGAAAGGFGAIPGAAIGSGAGSALGETLENALTGDSLGNNVLQEGLMGAAFGAGPIRGAKFALDAGKGLIKGGAKGLVDGSAKQVIRSASDEAAKFTLRGAAGNALANKSNQFATKQFGLTDGFIANYQKKYGEDAGKTLTRYGINTADEADEVIKKQQGIFDELVKGAGDIPADKIRNRLNTVGQELLTMGPSEYQQMGQKLLAETDQLVGQFGDKIPATALNNVRRQYDELVNYTTKQADPAKYGVNKRVADALRETIQEASGSKELKNTGMELSRLYTLSDEIAKRAPQVESRASSPVGFRNLLGATVGGGIGGVGGGVPGAIAGAALVSAANSPAGRRMITNASIGGAEKLIKSGAKAAPKQMTPFGTAARIGGLNLATDAATAQASPQPTLESALTDQSQSSGIFDMSQSPAMSPMIDQNSIDNIGQQYQAEPVSSSPYSKENLLSDINRDPQNANKYIAYYQQLDEIFNPKVDTPQLNSTQMQQANTAQSGIDSLGAISQAIQQNSSAPALASIPGGSFARNITGTGQYAAATANAVDAIGRLRSGGAINADEETRFRSLLPAAFDDPQTIQYKLQTLNSIFSRFANPQASRGGTLEDSLMTQGGYY